MITPDLRPVQDQNSKDITPTSSTKQKWLTSQIRLIILSSIFAVILIVTAIIAIVFCTGYPSISFNGTKTTNSIITTKTTRITSTPIATTTTSIPMNRINIQQYGDRVVGLYNTFAGNSTGGYNGQYSGVSEEPPYASDGNISTKYLNFGNTNCSNCFIAGVGTGFFVVPVVSNTTVARALLFATANDHPARDPITVTLEGSNSTTDKQLHNGSSWTLIYRGPTGIDFTRDPGRLVYVKQQNFINSMVFASYRLLVTFQRGLDNSVQYSEAQILGDF